MRQFGLRDLLWFVLLVAVSLAWWADHRRQSEATEVRVQALKQENAGLSSKVTFLESYNQQPLRLPR